MNEELRPPEGAEFRSHHWLQLDDYYLPIVWDNTVGWGIGYRWVSPMEAYRRGYRYHAPARPDDATERQRLEGEVARLRKELDALKVVIQKAPKANEFPAAQWDDELLFLGRWRDDVLAAAREALRHDR
jgi:hypothetical protein